MTRFPFLGFSVACFILGSALAFLFEAVRIRALQELVFSLAVASLCVGVIVKTFRSWP